MIDNCDCCGYLTDTKEYEEGIPRKKYNFCAVCANTFLSKAVVYPMQAKDSDLYKSVGYIANMILEEIRNNKSVVQ